VAPGLTASSHALAVDSLRIMGPLVSLQLSGSGFIAAQYATQGQALIQGSGMLYSASVVPAVVWLTPKIGPLSVAIGTGLSFVLMFVVVSGATFLLARRVSFFDVRNPVGPGSSLVVVMLASLLVCAQTFVGPIIGSTLAEGTVAQLSFAYRPIDVLSRALPSVIGYMVMPTVAAAYARRNAEAANSATSEGLRMALQLTLPIAALMLGVRDPLVSVLYERAAFSAQAVQAVAPTLGWYAVALPAYGLVLILTSVFLGGGRERWALVMSLLNLAIYLGMGLALGRQLGGAGVALSFCLANVSVAVASIVATGRRDVAGLLRTDWFRWTVLGTCLAALGGATAPIVFHQFSSIAQLSLGTLLGGAGALLGLIRAQPNLVNAVSRATRGWTAARGLTR